MKSKYFIVVCLFLPKLCVSMQEEQTKVVLYQNQQYLIFKNNTGKALIKIPLEKCLALSPIIAKKYKNKELTDNCYILPMDISDAALFAVTQFMNSYTQETDNLTQFLPSSDDEYNQLLALANHLQIKPLVQALYQKQEFLILRNTNNRPIAQTPLKKFVYLSSVIAKKQHYKQLSNNSYRLPKKFSNDAIITIALYVAIYDPHWGMIIQPHDKHSEHFNTLLLKILTKPTEYLTELLELADHFDLQPLTQLINHYIIDTIQHNPSLLQKLNKQNYSTFIKTLTDLTYKQLPKIVGTELIKNPSFLALKDPLVLTPSETFARKIALNPEGTLFALLSRVNKTCRADLYTCCTNPEPIYSFTNCTDIYFSPSGRYCIAQAPDEVFVFDCQQKGITTIKTDGEPFLTTAVDPMEKIIFFATNNKNYVKTLPNLEPTLYSLTTKYEYPIKHIFYSDDKTILITTQNCCSRLQFNEETQGYSEKAYIFFDEPVEQCALSPDGLMCIVITASKVYFLESKTLEIFFEEALEKSNHPRHIAFNGNNYCAVQSQQVCRIYSYCNKELCYCNKIRTYTDPDLCPITAICFVPGTHYLIITNNNNCQAYDLLNDEILYTLKASCFSGGDIAVTNKGNLILACYDVIKVFSAKDILQKLQSELQRKALELGKKKK